MSLLIVVTNTLTLFYLQKEIRAIRKSSKSDSQRQMAHMKTNISFYIQGCIIAFVMILTLFLSRSLTEAASSKLQYVIFSTLIWDLAQSSNGQVMGTPKKKERDQWNYLQHCSSRIQQAIALYLFTFLAKHYTSYANSWLLGYLQNTEINQYNLQEC
ncbi:unnamed protein product [Cylicocyclus nassatus]|uniref:7TM GPCR serpentine receptor class x (Srx) domain-containing protein n=1 Tax=Cylicocyclus nassatus TaxID=53992 RepID=A0AA36GYQ1_CYLNA|nr:unnamed protein product [Cylicocyclus nassatus]